MATVNYYERLLKRAAPGVKTRPAEGENLYGEVPADREIGPGAPGNGGETYGGADRAGYGGGTGYGGSGTGYGGGAGPVNRIGTRWEFPGDGKANVTYVDAAGERQTGLADTGQPGYFDSMRSYYEEMYNSQVEANNRALEKAKAQAQADTEAQMEALAEEYQGLNRQLYRDYMENRRTLPQEMAAQGYTGGLTESSRLRLTNAYEEALSENERARLSQEAGVNQSLNQRLYEAQAEADAANQQAAQDRYGYLAALLEAEQEQARAQLQDRADRLAQAGDFSVYLELGYSQSEVDAMTRAWLAKNPKLLPGWVQSHPAEAQRLGVHLPAASPSSSGGSSRRKSGKKKVDKKTDTDFRVGDSVIVGAVAAAMGGIQASKNAGRRGGTWKKDRTSNYV